MWVWLHVVTDLKPESFPEEIADRNVLYWRGVDKENRKICECWKFIITAQTLLLRMLFVKCNNAVCVRVCVFVRIYIYTHILVIFITSLRTWIWPESKGYHHVIERNIWKLLLYKTGCRVIWIFRLNCHRLS